jgi:catechol 2,3-dioxygenase-like lactoylglutathione lyase family enzyme
MTIQGISHLTFIVRDLARAARFFCDGLGGEEIYDSAAQNFSHSHEKFFMVGGVWVVAMQGEPTARSYRPCAFQIDAAHLDACQARLRAIGVEMPPPRPRVDGEGRSLYFYDFDNNLFELHTGTLAQRLTRYAAATPPPPAR